MVAPSLSRCRTCFAKVLVARPKSHVLVVGVRHAVPRQARLKRLLPRTLPLGLRLLPPDPETCWKSRPATFARRGRSGLSPDCCFACCHFLPQRARAITRAPPDRISPAPTQQRDK